MVPEGHAVTGVILIWVACATTRAIVMSRPELLPRVMFGSVVLQLGSVMMSTVLVSTKGHWQHAVLSKPHSSLTLG